MSVFKVIYWKQRLNINNIYDWLGSIVDLRKTIYITEERKRKERKKEVPS